MLPISYLLLASPNSLPERIMYKLRPLTTLNTNATRRHFERQAIRYLSVSASNMSPIIDAIKEDHRALEQYYNNIINAKDNDEATRWQNQFTWELARHSIGEELVVYPAFAKVLGEVGQQMADKDRAEHQTVGSSPSKTLRMHILTYRRSKKSLRNSKISRPVLQSFCPQSGRS